MFCSAMFGQIGGSHKRLSAFPADERLLSRVSPQVRLQAGSTIEAGDAKRTTETFLGCVTFGGIMKVFVSVFASVLASVFDSV